jgi:hypothetical protein
VARAYPPALSNIYTTVCTSRTVSKCCNGCLPSDRPPSRCISWASGLQSRLTTRVVSVRSSYRRAAVHFGSVYYLLLASQRAVPARGMSTSIPRLGERRPGSHSRRLAPNLPCHIGSKSSSCSGQAAWISLDGRFHDGQKITRSSLLNFQPCPLRRAPARESSESSEQEHARALLWNPRPPPSWEPTRTGLEKGRNLEREVVAVPPR